MRRRTVATAASWARKAAELVVHRLELGRQPRLQVLQVEDVAGGFLLVVGGDDHLLVEAGDVVGEVGHRPFDGGQEVTDLAGALLRHLDLLAQQVGDRPVGDELVDHRDPLQQGAEVGAEVVGHHPLDVVPGRPRLGQVFGHLDRDLVVGLAQLGELLEVVLVPFLVLEDEGLEAFAVVASRRRRRPRRRSARGVRWGPWIDPPGRRPSLPPSARYRPPPPHSFFHHGTSSSSRPRPPRAPSAGGSRRGPSRSARPGSRPRAPGAGRARSK